MQHRTMSTGRGARSSASPDAMARGLGWFSIALGLTQLAAPRVLTRAVGMEGYEPVVRACGMREITTGVGILASRDPTPWLWGRVAGDALDIVGLAAACRRDNLRKGNVGLALAAAAGVTALDMACAQRLHAGASRPARPIPDYSDRSGFPRPADAMRGAARDFVAPRDMRAPEAMRPYTVG